MGVLSALAFLFPANPNMWYRTKGMWPRYDDWFADLYHYDTTFSYLHAKTFFTAAERLLIPHLLQFLTIHFYRLDHTG